DERLLVETYREPEPHLVWIVEHADVVAPGPEPALEPEPVEREGAGVSHAQLSPSSDHAFVDVGDELGRNDELPPQLAGERHAQRERLRPPEVDLPRRQERERLVRQVLIGELTHHLATLR